MMIPIPRLNPKIAFDFWKYYIHLLINVQIANTNQINNPQFVQD